MNINSIQNYPMNNSRQRFRVNRGKETAGECAKNSKDKKNVNRGYYGGSFTGLNGAAAKRSMQALRNILDLCRDDTVIAQNLVALILAGVFRPIAIMELPGKKNEQDKKYAAGHAIASGVIGFIFSCIIMYPFGRAVKQVEKNVAKYLNSEKFEKIYGVKLSEMKNSKAFSNVKSCVNMILDTFIFGILKAKMTIAMIPPILKYGFGLEKSKKSKGNNQTNAKPDMAKNVKNLSAFKSVKPKMAEFAGGDK